MAKVMNGLVIGRVGHLVYYVRDGQQCVRTLAPKQKKPQSPAQLLQQAKFTAMQQWLTPLKDYFRAFPVKGLSKAAFSSSIRQACTAEGSKVGIDASKMVLTQGPLCAMEGGAFTLEGRTLHLSWNDNTRLIMSDATDRLVWLLYNPDTMTYLSDLGAQRMPHRFERHCSIELPATAKGSYHLYATFCNIHGNAISDSVYLGEVKL